MIEDNHYVSLLSTTLTWSTFFLSRIAIWVHALSHSQVGASMNSCVFHVLQLKHVNRNKLKTIEGREKEVEKKSITRSISWTEWVSRIERHRIAMRTRTYSSNINMAYVCWGIRMFEKKEKERENAAFTPKHRENNVLHICLCGFIFFLTFLFEFCPFHLVVFVFFFPILVAGAVDYTVLMYARCLYSCIVYGSFSLFRSFHNFFHFVMFVIFFLCFVFVAA